MSGPSPDVLVVGAGVAGAATCYFLARTGLRVLLVETEHPAAGASGRNPGFLWLQTKTAGPQMQVALACRAFAGTLGEEVGDFRFRACGGMIHFRDPEAEPVARAFVADRCAAGLPVELVDGAAARGLCPALGPAIRGAVWNPLDASQSTPMLIDRLIARARSFGAELRTGVRASRVITEGDRCLGVELDSGERLTAGATVLATGIGSPTLLAGLGYRMPTMLYVFEAAETSPAPFSIGPVTCGQSLFRFFDPAAPVPRHPIELANPDLGFTEQATQSPDGRVQFGCGFRILDAPDDRPTVAGQALAASIHMQNFPGLAGLPLERAWAGAVLQTADGIPAIGQAPGVDGLWLNLGHFFGNLAGGLSGRLMADLITGGPPVLDPALVSPARPALGLSRA